MSRYSPRARLTNSSTTSTVANWFGNQFVAVPSGFEPIATITVGAGGSSSPQFTSIPGTYKHLQIRVTARRTGSETGGATDFLRFNSDSGTNYSWHYLYGYSGGAAAGSLTSLTKGYVVSTTGGGQTSGYFSSSIIDILDYADTNKAKTVRMFAGDGLNGNSVKTYSTAWLSNSAITSITFGTDANAYAQYTHIALYGLKGA